MDRDHPCIEHIDFVQNILSFLEEVNELRDLDAILDSTLFEARNFSGADAGTIFLQENNRLHFSYVQNDSLDANEAKIQQYIDATLPIDEHSLVGHVALSGQPLRIDDAYAIPAGYPFRFNQSFDLKTGYRTRSILTLPMRTSRKKNIGVMQLINPFDRNGQPVPFSTNDLTYLPLLANNASAAIERGILTRELILRMMRMAELRDPHETGPHVQRVGAYAAEIYDQWAQSRGVAEENRKSFRDLLRIAAMLHDVGKVGISDTILKKPARLAPQEFEIMKGHTLHGARLFANSTSELDRMAAEIALNHHEKWDGSGYPGFLTDLNGPGTVSGPPKQGEQIPLSARITALADVFDAISSKRCYKEAWAYEDALGHIKEQSGKHFDPDVVRAFLEIQEVIKAIRVKFKDHEGDANASELQGKIPF